MGVVEGLKNTHHSSGPGERWELKFSHATFALGFYQHPEFRKTTQARLSKYAIEGTDDSDCE
jgi:hypothetical protein